MGKHWCCAVERGLLERNYVSGHGCTCVIDAASGILLPSSIGVIGRWAGLRRSAMFVVVGVDGSVFAVGGGVFIPFFALLPGAV